MLASRSDLCLGRADRSPGRQRRDWAYHSALRSSRAADLYNPKTDRLVASRHAHKVGRICLRLRCGFLRAGLAILDDDVNLLVRFPDVSDLNPVPSGRMSSLKHGKDHLRLEVHWWRRGRRGLLIHAHRRTGPQLIARTVLTWLPWRSMMPVPPPLTYSQVTLAAMASVMAAHR